MTRIISGFAGSLALKVPGSGTRPTSDRVREAIFSALDAQDRLDGARVLDLYAGSGALGLEAASRGGTEVLLVERDRQAAAVARQNVATVLAAARATRTNAPDVRLAVQSVAAWLAEAAPVPHWTIAFLDPPYDLPDAELLAALTALTPLLAEDAVVVVERSTRSGAPVLPDGLVLDRSRSYGETALHWLSRP